MFRLINLNETIRQKKILKKKITVTVKKFLKEKKIHRYFSKLIRIVFHPIKYSKIIREKNSEKNISRLP